MKAGQSVMMKNLLIIGVILCFISSAMAGKYYVSTSGSDNNNGSFTAPWLKIKYAWEHTGGGDTVLVRGGSYSEGSSIWLVGGHKTNKMWTLMAYPDETVILKTRITVDNSYVRIQGFIFEGAAKINVVRWDGMHEHIEIVDNTFKGGDGASSMVSLLANNSLIQNCVFQYAPGVNYAIYHLHGANNVIRNNYAEGFEGHTFHIYDEDKYDGEPDPAIQNLLIEYNTIVNTGKNDAIILAMGGSDGAQPLKLRNVTIKNNIFAYTKGGGDGIAIRYDGEIRKIYIYNNVIYGHTDDGISIGAENADSIYIKNNIIANNSTTNFHISSSIPHLWVENNLYYQPTAVGEATDAHAIFGDPKFVDAEHLDFHLQAGSPAIDQGINLGYPYAGSAPDIGAYEYGYSATRKFNDTKEMIFQLNQNYPNPFNAQTSISYTLLKPAKIELSIYNVLGQKIKTLVDNIEAAGTKSVQWNGLDDRGQKVGTGVYFYRLEADQLVTTKKMMLVE